MEDESEEVDVGAVNRLVLLEAIVSHELDSTSQFRGNFCLSSFYWSLEIFDHE